MGAKVMITGPAKAVQFNKKKNKWTFRISAKPAFGNSPKGMKMFGSTEYHIECTNRQWRRGHASENDNSDLVIEGYQEPRQDKGKLYIAVVAMSVSTKGLQTERKFNQIKGELDKAIDTFREGKGASLPPDQLRDLAAQVVKAEENLNKFIQKNKEPLSQLGIIESEEPAPEEPNDAIEKEEAPEQEKTASETQNVKDTATEDAEEEKTSLPS